MYIVTSIKWNNGEEVEVYLLCMQLKGSYQLYTDYFNYILYKLHGKYKVKNIEQNHRREKLIKPYHY